MRKHVVLVGLPGSGKTTVGPLVAAHLGAPFVDLDRAIEQRDGRSIPRIFAESGESAFRALEAGLFRETLAAPPCVIAAGGGLLDVPENLRLAREVSLLVHLEVRSEVAARRIGDPATRPLLGGAEAAGRLGELLVRRAPSYREAQQRVTTDELTPEEVAGQVAVLARVEGGW